MENEEMNTVENQASVPYFVHEAEMARQERTVKRLWILCIIMFLALVITNGGWVYYESQFEDVVTTESYESDATGGGVAISNGSGEVNYNGESEVYEDNEDPEAQDGRQ